MSIPTATPIEITRRRLAALLLAVTASASTLTWAVTAAADTAAEPVRTGQTAAGRALPIVVADAYHGVGTIVCPDGAEPIQVADSYHGVGAAVCP